MSKPSQFWIDLQQDLEDPEFYEAYAVASEEITDRDARANRYNELKGR